MKFRMLARTIAPTLVLGLTFVAGTAVLLAPAVAKADDDKESAKKAKALGVGDTAPALKFEKFIKGSEVTEFKKGHVYVVEMWATWCGPCIRTFPHLSELQEKHKDKVTIIGVNVWEDSRKPYTSETPGMIAKFVEDEKDIMRYTVAYDGATKNFVKTWGEPAGVQGIPHAFIVDGSGKIAWMGHPGTMDKVLEAVVNGTWDPAKAKAAGEIDKKIMQKFKDGDQDAALELMLEKIEKYPTMSDEAALGVFGMWMQKGETKKAYEKGNAWVDGLFKDNAEALNGVAWTIVDPDADVKDKNLDLAMKAATRANELTGNKDAATLDTLARVYFVKGDKAKALELQQKAVDNSTGAMKKQLEKALEEYK